MQKSLSCLCSAGNACKWGEVLGEEELDMHKAPNWRILQIRMNININILHILFSPFFRITKFTGWALSHSKPHIFEIVCSNCQALCSHPGLESTVYSGPHPASFKPFLFSSFSGPGLSSGVKPIPFPTQSTATWWYRTRTSSTSLVAKEVTSKSKSKRNWGCRPPN